MLYCDLETYSTVPINAGTWAYAEAAEVMLWTYALDDGPVQCGDVPDGGSGPPDLAAWLADESIMTVWHNGRGFDRTVLHLHYPELCPPPERILDTMQQALAHSLPGSLDKLGSILGAPHDARKNQDGKALIQLFCKPRPKNQKLRRADKHTHPDEWARFIQYAMDDIPAMRWIAQHLPKWNYPNNREEWALSLLDTRINSRGVCIDTELVHAAIETADRVGAQLREDCYTQTRGAVPSATQRDVLLDYLRTEFDLPTLEDIKGSTVDTLLEKVDLPDELRQLLLIRTASTKTSTAKYRKLLAALSPDGRMRGLLQFLGAMRTGRWAGRLFQPQNLPRVLKWIAKTWESTIESIKVGTCTLLHDSPMEALSAVLRGVIVASKGRKLVVADLSNIEGRVLAWLAGEEWKLDAFRDFDDGIGADLYVLAYARAFHIPVEEVGDGDKRQIGKVLELSMGYQGGVGAFLTFALAYGMDLNELAERAWPTLPSSVLGKSQAFLEWLYAPSQKQFDQRIVADWSVEAAEAERAEAQAAVRQGLSVRTWMVCDCLKRLWRMAHPNTERLWSAVEGIVRQAIWNPGQIFHYRGLSARKDGNWLRIRLPSGRFLCYPQAMCSEDGQIRYRGVHQITRKWAWLKTYGGKLVENITQATARDVLAHNMPMIDDAGYEIVLSVHDELITEAPDQSEYSAEDLSRRMSAPPPWAPDLPLAAKGFEGPRYRKD